MRLGCVPGAQPHAGSPLSDSWPAPVCHMGWLVLVKVPLFLLLVPQTHGVQRVGGRRRGPAVHLALAGRLRPLDKAIIVLSKAPVGLVCSASLQCPDAGRVSSTSAACPGRGRQGRPALPCPLRSAASEADWLTIPE